MDDLAHLPMLRAMVLDELVGRETPDVLVRLQVQYIDLRVRGPEMLFEHL